MITLDMIRQYAQVSVGPKEPPAKQKTTTVATTTPAIPKPKETPKGPKSSKAAAARAKAPAPLVQEPAASESHEEDDELAKAPDSTPQVKETQDDASTKKVSLDPQDSAKTTNIGSNLDPQ